MKRTTIFLPDDVHEALRQEAFRRRLSMAELIRRRLTPSGHRRRTRRKRETDPILAVAGILSDGTLNQNLDEELYEL